MKPSELSDKVRGCLTMLGFWTAWSKTPLSDKQFDVLKDRDTITTPAQCPSYLLSGTHTDTGNTHLGLPFLSCSFPEHQSLVGKYAKQVLSITTCG